MNAAPTTPPPAEAFFPAARDQQEDGFVVLDACHRRMLGAVDALEQIAASVDRDGVTDAVRATAAAIADFLSNTVRRHHEDEDRHVFPALAAGGDPQIAQAVLRLEQDHGWLEEDWLELEPHVQAIASGYGTFDKETLCQGVPVFAALLRDHIALEEAVIYPQARARLGKMARREMGREMARRRRAERAQALR
jgi:hemerythrin-like domain-containing protein